ncbi:MAG: metal ABC transporter substrate-binding protein, partial [Planctomycetia bacterium]
MNFGIPKPRAFAKPPVGSTAGRPVMRPVPLLIAAMLVGGCSAREAATPRGKPLVVATTTIVADLVRQVAGDRVAIDCLLGDGIDPHSYKATPRDADRLRAATLVVASGLHLEGKLSDLLDKLSATRPVVVVADAVPRELLLDAGGGFQDPHIWFDARLWSRCIPAVEEALTKIDPAGGTEYRRRADAHRVE